MFEPENLDDAEEGRQASSSAPDAQELPDPAVPQYFPMEGP